MKTRYILIIMICLCACKKTAPALSSTLSLPQTDFVEYTIPQGQQYSDLSSFIPVSYSTLKFVVKFDSSAIYKTLDPVNQYDINKLYGFSDNNEEHHLYSARFGWRWSEDALHLFGYTYNNGIRDSKELGTIAIGSEADCSITAAAGQYYFSLNGKVDSMTRASQTVMASGYKLFPYFGGDEMAPHTIHVWIKELN